MAEFILEALNINKAFGGVKALDNVSLRLGKNSFHALLGENGAGKSTLVKCIMGYYQPDSGQLLMNNRQEVITSPQIAAAKGIGMVYQHFTLIPNMTIAENILLSRPVVPLVIPWKTAIGELEEKMAQMPFQFDLKRYVRDLSVGEKQKVEITKQLLLNSKILILDEPTSVLTPAESDEVLGKVYDLTKAGTLSVLMISHKFREVMQYADTVTVLRKGKYVGSAATRQVTTEHLADMMLGGDKVKSPPARTQLKEQAVRLEVEGLSVQDDQLLDAVKKVSFSIRAGEILGIAGVSGNGQKQLVEALAGQRPKACGSIKVAGRDYEPTQTRALAEGFYCLPEEPLRNACVPNMSLADNLSLRQFNQPAFSRWGWLLNRKAMRSFAEQKIHEYAVRTQGPEQPIKGLSGGNIQRVVLARELAANLNILVVANPCFGLDFKAVADIRGRILTARNEGAAVLLLSEDLDEVLALSDRLYVISGGQLLYETTPQQADLNTIGQYMAGH
ncbi:MAG TPA: ABC transporter ATP-binding protein [Cellvibrionaceae bacterium]